MMRLNQLLGLGLAIGLSFASQETLAENKNLSGYQVDTESLCGGYPKAIVKTPEGTCMGVVASKEDGLLRPRRILSLGKGEFIITDMKGWAPNAGKVWHFNSYEKKLTPLFEGVDHAHGLGLGPDGLVYIGTRSSIFRFDPASSDLKKEVVINDLPLEGNHPMTHFIFDHEGSLIVNVGAPSDQCLDEKKRPQYPCPESEGDSPQAVLRLYKRTDNGDYIFDRVIAKGLRNSMALAIEPNTGALYQGENGMDFKDLGTPLEEINLIEEGAHYGWPYCYEKEKLNPKYKRTFFNRRVPKIDCSIYRGPVAMLPAHSAPLDMMFYQGAMFPELEGKLIVSLHGYRETGQRIVSLDLNQGFVPMGETRKEIVSAWSGESGLTPKGAPVGMTTDEEGNIFFVEDKNKTIMVLTKGSAAIGGQTSDVVQVKLSQAQKQTFKGLQNQIFNKSCVACHGQFSGASEVVVNNLIKERMIVPGQGKDSLLVKRISGNTMGPQMPLGDTPIHQNLTGKLIQFIDGLIN